MDSATLANYAQIASFILMVLAMLWPMFKGKWPDKPRILVYSFLAVWVVTTTYLYFKKPEVTVYQGTTSLKLLFAGGGQIPQPQSQENIYRWYALKNITVLFDKKGNRTDVPSWTIVLTFEKDISPTYLHIKSNGQNLPLHEVKDFSPRHAVISIGGEVPPGVVELTVDKPSDS